MRFFIWYHLYIFVNTVVFNIAKTLFSSVVVRLICIIFVTTEKIHSTGKINTFYSTMEKCTKTGIVYYPSVISDETGPCTQRQPFLSLPEKTSCKAKIQWDQNRIWTVDLTTRGKRLQLSDTLALYTDLTNAWTTKATISKNKAYSNK